MASNSEREDELSPVFSPGEESDGYFSPGGDRRPGLDGVPVKCKNEVSLLWTITLAEPSSRANSHLQGLTWVFTGLYLYYHLTTCISETGR